MSPRPREQVSPFPKVRQYVTNHRGTVHVAPTDDGSPASLSTLCGQTIRDGWVYGDETITGIAATCTTCFARTVRR